MEEHAAIRSVSTWPGTAKRYPPRVRLLLSVLALVWLLTLLVATVAQTDRLYPLTSFSMFSHPTGGLNVQFELEAMTEGGKTRSIAPNDYGLTELQLRSFLGRQVGAASGELRPGANARVADLARIWADRHGVELQELTVVRVERSVTQPTPVRTELVTWSP